MFFGLIAWLRRRRATRATAAFFEKPCQLQKKHPQLYEALAEYYGPAPPSGPTRAAPA